MYKQFYSITLAGLIGISTGLYGAEVAPIKAAELAAEVAVMPVVTPVVAIPEAVVLAAPILVPFDRDLYKHYCELREETYDKAWTNKFAALIMATIITATYVQAAVAFPYEATALAAQATVVGWWKLSLLSKAFSTISATVFAVPGALWKAFGFYQFVGLFGTGLYNLTTLTSDAEACYLWGERKTIAELKKSALWREEVYARFGKPEIVGTVPVTGKYKFKGYKRNGVELIFDPFNREQVRALLGLIYGENYWHFVKLEVIPVEEPIATVVAAIEVEEIKTEVKP